MAEIKSTIDLVMERTKHLVQTPEERDRAEKQEIENQVNGLLLRLREGTTQPVELPRILDEASDRTRSHMREILLRTMISGLNFDQDQANVLVGLEILVGGEALPSLTGRFRGLVAEYQEKIMELDAETKGQVLEELAVKGITGTALKSKTPTDPAVSDVRDEVLREFDWRLRDIRSAMLEHV